MAVLINHQQGITTENSTINQSTGLDMIASFLLSDSLQRQITQQDNNNANALFAALATQDIDYCSGLGLSPTKVAVIDAKQNKRVLSSEKPHINPGDEVHFVLDGSFVLYLLIDDKLHSLILQKGDRLKIPQGIEHWIQMTEDHYLMLASFHSEPFDSFHKKVVYTATVAKQLFK